MQDVDQRAEGHPGSRFLLRKLGGFTSLSPDDVAAIQALPMAIEVYPAGHHLARENDKPTACHLVLDGFACRHKSLRDGRRQILSFHTPGDILELQSLYLETLDYGVTTLIPTTVGCLPRAVLQDLARNNPGIARAFWRDTLVDAAIYREWLLGLGRRSARTHLAHMLCELVVRLAILSSHEQDPAASGMAPAVDVGPLPLSRNDLADALGLTVVEVNRELFGLRQEALIETGTASVTVLDFPRLARICDFDAGYLYQDRAA